MTYTQREQVERGDLPPGVLPYVSPVQPGNGLGFTIPIIGVDTSTIGGIASGISSLFGGGGGSDGNVIKTKAWSKVPLNLIRVQGGHGKWSDPVTGEQMGDAGTDQRKLAVVGSAIGLWNGPNSFDTYDVSTNQYLDAGPAWQRWLSVFGDIDFPTAYSRYPERFRIYQPTTSAYDPIRGPTAQREVGQYVAPPAFSPQTGGLPIATAAPGAPNNPGTITTATPARSASTFSVSPVMLVGAAAGIAALAFAFTRKRRRA